MAVAVNRLVAQGRSGSVLPTAKPSGFYTQVLIELLRVYSLAVSSTFLGKFSI
jgi:hypothetical protein